MANSNTNSSVDKEKGCIAGGLPLKAMRLAMENKGLLGMAGALYCGTGRIIPVTVGNDTYNIPETIAVNPPTNVVENGVTYGIQFTLSADNKVVDSAVLVPVQPQ